VGYIVGKNVGIIWLPNCGGIYYIHVVHLEQQQAATITLLLSSWREKFERKKVATLCRAN